MILSKQSYQPRDIKRNHSTNAVKAKVSIQEKQDLRSTPQPAWHLDIHRFCQDLFSPSGMNYTDANAFDLQNRLRLSHRPAADKACGIKKKNTPDPSPFESQSGSEVFGLILIIGIHRRVIMQSGYTGL